MEFIRDIDDSNKLLKEFVGGNAHVEVYSSTFRRLVIKINSTDSEKIIFLVAVGCEHFSGPFSWQGINLRINQFSEKDRIITKILDSGAQFELMSIGGFSIAYGLEIELLPLLRMIEA